MAATRRGAKQDHRPPQQPKRQPKRAERSDAAALVAALPQGSEEESDGRRRRGNTSRARIVDAMMQLIREGRLAPSASRVAEVAGVSLRTVFRHFEEMDSLYQEISEAIQARVLPAFFRPYQSADWRGQLDEMIERRIDLYEQILPFKLSGELRRHQSEYLANDYRQHLRLEKMSLESLLPEATVADPWLAQGLRSVTSFQHWRALRQDHELEVAAAKATVLRVVDALLASAAARPGAAEPAPANAPARSTKARSGSRPTTA